MSLPTWWLLTAGT